GVRAHPDVKIGDYVHIMGIVEEHEETLQIEIETLDILGEESKTKVKQRLDEAITQRASPPEISPLVQWDVLEELSEDLRELATQLRRAVLENRPIRLRHHADGDGICASVPVQLALEQFIEETHTDPKAKQHLVRRLPSKAPFYEMEDATRDLNFSLQNQDKHGQKLPILFMLDNGSTKEDTSAYEAVKHYDIPIFVLDHHHPDPDAVEPFVDQHVNPYLIGEDYRITTGMMAVELARMISPAITDEVRHIPAVAGIADRSEADTMATYLEIAADVGYSEDFLEDISEALDYIAYWLRYNPGNHLLNDILNVGGNEDRHRDLVTFLASNAQSEVEDQIDNAWPHIDQRYIADDILLSTIDVENYAYRFTYPAPGKTTGEIHDQIVEKEGTPAITIGYGPDFAVLRSDGVRLDIPRMVAELNEEIEGGGVQGGGHLVVGSIQFVAGMQDEVLDALIDKMAEAELDEEMKTQRPS
ncbi:MAG: DHH family phosphoesterase, partial [Halobacteriaceae archaeon]